MDLNNTTCGTHLPHGAPVEKKKQLNNNFKKQNKKQDILFDKGHFM